ncbi:hypothetical protein CC2G_006540 [Coprinopsis cinerea AmutBmut pab1-1]|nr:hypothetical protein CC2G_006540 [Coprinopsis cinerea AmutBmut pab1-1]
MEWLYAPSTWLITLKHLRTRSSICGKAPAGTSLDSSSSFRDTPQSHKSHSSFVCSLLHCKPRLVTGCMWRFWVCHVRSIYIIYHTPHTDGVNYAGVMTWVGEAFPIVILLLCLYALYGSKRRHAPAFWGSYFVYMGVQLATLVVYIVHTRLPPLAVRGTNCYTTNTSFGDRFMMANRILRLSLHVGTCSFKQVSSRWQRDLNSSNHFLHTVMFLLAAWKGARRYRRLKSPLIKTVLGGEMAYYGGVFAMAALDVVARYYSPNDPARLKILTYISRFGAPVLANRLLVNMYKTAHHGGAGSAHSLSGLRFAGDSTVSLTEVNTDYY